MSTAKTLRKQLKLSQTAAAALADVSPHVWRVYEIDPKSVHEDSCVKCDAAVAEMQSRLSERRAA